MEQDLGSLDDPDSLASKLEYKRQTEFKAERIKRAREHLARGKWPKLKMKIRDATRKNPIRKPRDPPKPKAAPKKKTLKGLSSEQQQAASRANQQAPLLGLPDCVLETILKFAEGEDTLSLSGLRWRKLEKWLAPVAKTCQHLREQYKTYLPKMAMYMDYSLDLSDDLSRLEKRLALIAPEDLHRLAVLAIRLVNVPFAREYALGDLAYLRNKYLRGTFIAKKMFTRAMLASGDFQTMKEKANAQRRENASFTEDQLETLANRTYIIYLADGIDLDGSIDAQISCRCKDHDAKTHYTPSDPDSIDTKTVRRIRKIQRKDPDAVACLLAKQAMRGATFDVIKPDACHKAVHHVFERSARKSGTYANALRRGWVNQRKQLSQA